jgi:hypothetical protein
MLCRMRGLPDLPSRWTLALGPGARTAGLAPLLGALRGASETPRLVVLEDLAQLFDRMDPEGRLLLDAELLPREDLGLLRRFLERLPGWRIWLVGDDPRAGAAATLCGERRARWLPWPLDVEFLPRLLEPPSGATTARATEPDEPEAPQHRDAREDQFDDLESEPPAWRALPEAPDDARAAAEPEGDELAEIEAILSDPDYHPGAPRSTPPGPAPDPFAGDDPEPFLAAPDLSPAPARLPRWYRSQVADLADLAQRLQLSILALRERRVAGEDGARALDELEADVLRLVMFARTLGFLAAPPPPGASDLDLSVLLRELLGGLSGADGGAPRFLLDAAPELAVRADKGLLVQAFDALLALPMLCGSRGDVVRLVVRSSDGTVEVDITFPAGPLEGREPADVLEPYGLRRVLPEVGANALAAAGAIFEGQGGQLALDRLRDGSLRFRVELPRAALPARHADGLPQRPGGPFE